MEATTRKEQRQQQVQLIKDQSTLLIPIKEWLSFREVLIYTGKSNAWFCRMKKDYNIVKSESGYYRRKDIDKIFKAQTFANTD